MDRQQLLGFTLIFLLLIVWMWMTTPPPQPPTSPQDVISDTLAQPRQATALHAPEQQETPNQYGRFFGERGAGEERVITIETDRFKAEFTTKGGLVKTWELKEYKTWDGKVVQLVDSEAGGDLSLLFVTTDGRRINTRNLFFEGNFQHNSYVKLSGEETYEVRMTLPAANGGRITKVYTLKDGHYGFEVRFEFAGMEGVIANFEYQVLWEHGLLYAERNSFDESAFAAAYAYAGKELIEIDAASFNETANKDLTGVVDWVATRNKYFAVALISREPRSGGAFLEGSRHALPEDGEKERYSIAVKMPFKGISQETSVFTVFLGPLDIGLLRSFDIGLESIMSLGWVWIIRPISEYVMLPLMSAINYVIPNWGLVIIVFSFIIKIALHPLTKSSMKSMKKMQALQPMMEEIRQKHKDDPQKMNTAIMNMYREYGVNPAGGCLPLLLQFPILIALYNVFIGAIELRQAEFVWWINDLSVPDVLFTLPFKIPIFGIQGVSGLALFMGITMFIQQKMTIKDPRQKMLVWLMPILFTLLFNNFPSGLNLYYFVFNLLSIIQQYYINKQHDGEPLKKVEPKKRRGKGIFRNLNIPKLPK